MNTKEIRNKILLDLFITPLSIIPTTTGISVLLICFAINKYELIFLVGLGSMLFGFGVALSNLIFNWGKLVKTALEQLKEEEKLKKAKDIQSLYNDLSKTKGKKDEELLVSLNFLYQKFQEDIENKNLNISVDIISQIESMFKECIDSLKYSFQLYQSSFNVPKSKTQEILDKRELVLQEVSESLNLMTDTILQFRTFETKEKQMKLNQLREDLKSQIKAAINTKDQMMEIEYSEKDYSEYLEK